MYLFYSIPFKYTRSCPSTEAQDICAGSREIHNTDHVMNFPRSSWAKSFVASPHLSLSLSLSLSLFPVTSPLTSTPDKDKNAFFKKIYLHYIFATNELNQRFATDELQRLSSHWHSNILCDCGLTSRAAFAVNLLQINLQADQCLFNLLKYFTSWVFIFMHYCHKTPLRRQAVIASSYQCVTRHVAAVWSDDCVDCSINRCITTYIWQ